MTVNRLAIPDDERTPRTAAEWLWPLLPIGVSMFCLSALLYYHLRHDVVEVSSALQVTIAGIYRWFGFAPSFLFFLLLLTWSSIWFATGSIVRPVSRVLRLLAMTVMLGVAMNLGEGGVVAAFPKGELGAWLAGRLCAAFGYYPTLVLVWGVTFGSLMLATDFFFSESFERLRSHPAPADTGVETAVTDHLKGLATVAGAGDGAAGTGDGASPAATGVPAVEAEAEGDVEVEPAVGLLDDPLPGPSRRRSYFERRYEAERTEPAGEETWVPTAPDAQEIDNPETEGRAAVEASAGAEASPDGGAAEPAVLAPAAAPPSAELRAFAEDEDFDDEFVPPAAAGGIPQPGTADAGADAGIAAEPLVAIPRPDAAPVAQDAASAAVAGPPGSPPAALASEAFVLPARDGTRQQSLFAQVPDEDLVDEAAAVVRENRRVSAALLQRKLRIDYDAACRVLVELQARGIVQIEGDQAHGRAVGN